MVAEAMGRLGEWATRALGGEQTTPSAQLLARAVAAAQAHGLEVKRLGEVTGGAILLFSPKGGASKLIAAGFHGDEPAGALAVVQYLEQGESLEGLAFVPLMNPSGFDERTRLDADGLNPNRDYGSPGASASAEVFTSNAAALVPLARDLYLTLHEDYDEDRAFYFYASGDRGFIAEVYNQASQYFEPLAGRDMAIQAEDRGDATSEAFMLNQGVATVITVETPSEASLERRIAAHMAIIRAAAGYNFAQPSVAPASLGP